MNVGCQTMLIFFFRGKHAKIGVPFIFFVPIFAFLHEELETFINFSK